MSRLLSTAPLRRANVAGYSVTREHRTTAPFPPRYDAGVSGSPYLEATLRGNMEGGLIWRGAGRENPNVPGCS